MTHIRIIIIDDDPEMETRPFYEELVNIYGTENVIWISNPDLAIEKIKEDIVSKTIVILDYDFGSPQRTGYNVFEDIHQYSSLLYVILNTAKSIKEIPDKDIKNFINNQLMAITYKTDGYELLLTEVKRAISYLNNRIDSVIEEWILRYKKYNSEYPLFKNGVGEIITASQFMNELRTESAFGKMIIKSVLNIAISKIQQDMNNEI